MLSLAAIARYLLSVSNVAVIGNAMRGLISNSSLAVIDNDNEEPSRRSRRLSQKNHRQQIIFYL